MNTGKYYQKGFIGLIGNVVSALVGYVVLAILAAILFGVGVVTYDGFMGFTEGSVATIEDAGFCRDEIMKRYSSDGKYLLFGGGKEASFNLVDLEIKKLIQWPGSLLFPEKTKSEDKRYYREPKEEFYLNHGLVSSGGSSTWLKSLGFSEDGKRIVVLAEGYLPFAPEKPEHPCLAYASNTKCLFEAEFSFSQLGISAIDLQKSTEGSDKNNLEIQSLEGGSFKIANQDTGETFLINAQVKKEDKWKLSPDRRYFAVGGDDRLIVWDLVIRKEVVSASPYRHTASCLDFTPGGKYLLTSSYSEIKLWELPSVTEKLVRRISNRQIGSAKSARKKLVSANNKLINDCDRLAADPLDLNKTGAGVDAGEFDGQEARLACKLAVSLYPDTPRYEYQYGRALVLSGLHEKAYPLLRNAANAGYPAAMNAVGVIDAEALLGRKDCESALGWYKKAVDLGDPSAAFNLGLLFDHGDCVAQDRLKAAEYYRKSAEQETAIAQYYLGQMYENGEGVEKDLLSACDWYVRAAENGENEAVSRIIQLAREGVGEAQYYLGYLSEDGIGVNKDLIEAAKWYRLAAKQDHSYAQNNLGLLYMSGEGVEQNVAEGVRLVTKSAEQGNAIAQANIGTFYMQEANMNEALKWYQKAAAQGQLDAQYYLGIIYRDAQDYAKAAKWLKTAAEKGDKDAMHILAGFYKTGQGVSKDLAVATRWYERAAGSGDK